VVYGVKSLLLFLFYLFLLPLYFRTYSLPALGF
jgi:hypothetical protein